jgi:FtsP/CotA-like multicopper oxidase with cupredoxin domain
MIEFDAAATFTLHANFFDVYPTGDDSDPNEENDVITMGTAERHILEFSYRYPGNICSILTKMRSQKLVAWVCLTYN